MLAGYLEAELVASRIGACYSGFYIIPPGEDFTGDGIDNNGTPLSDASPGTFERLPKGWDFKAFNPQHPTTQFGEFVKSCLRQIAGGLNVIYQKKNNQESPRMISLSHSNDGKGLHNI